MRISQRETTAAAMANGGPRVLAVVVLVLGVGMTMAEEPQRQAPAPRLICAVGEGSGVERTPAGEIRVSNLEPVPLRVVLLDSGLAVEPPRVGAEGATVEIEVSQVVGDERSEVPVKVTQTATSAAAGQSRLEILLEIPLTEEERRAALDGFLQRLEAESREQGRLEEFRRLSADRDALLKGLQGFQAENRTGEFEVRCTYRSQSPGFWNGEVHAPPLPIEVRNDGSAFDQIFATGEGE